MDPKNSKRLASSRDLSRILGVAPTTVARWAARGRIPCVRLSARCLRYDVDTVMDALASDRARKGVARGK